MTTNKDNKELEEKIDELLLRMDQKDPYHTRRNGIKELIYEEIVKARIETAEYIQNNFVSRAGGFCDEILPESIPNYIKSLEEEIKKGE